MTNAPLLVELFTEELPPKALRRLGEAFAAGVADGLRRRGLATAEAAVDGFATPRRLAVRVAGVPLRGPERRVEVKGPSVKVALDAQGAPTQALLKWAERVSAPVDALRRASDGKQECFFHTSVQPGERLDEAIDAILAETLEALPIPKLMQYQLADGRTTVAFVRPAHGLVVLHGARTVPASVLGLNAGRTTHGHRFLGTRDIELADADAYETRLAGEGRVIASFEARRARIDALLRQRADALGASLGDEAAVAPLLDEVTALVEWPAVYVGEFEPEFLDVPQECLILTMRTNQKYFPLFDAQGRLQPRFLIVSNLEVEDPRSIVDGNQRVVRPRLADARFFFDQDRRTTLASRVPQLATVVYHARLGTQAQRSRRVETIAVAIAARLGLDAAAAGRAAQLAKCDLLTGMVGEFPELQGTMGTYYARHDGEPEAVAQALSEQYQPRFAGDALPGSALGAVLALADKLETLAGLFGIGQVPTGDRDPFALRRHALGVIRMLVERSLPLPLSFLLETAFSAFRAPEAGAPALVAQAPEQLRTFVHERLGGWLRERGWSAAEVAAVVEQAPERLDDVPRRLEAVRRFAAMPEAVALAAANKRIGNLLRKAGAEAPDGTALDAALLVEPAERALAARLAELRPGVDAAMGAGDYTGALTLLAGAREPVDAFFEHVMVMAEDPGVRRNRLALLASLGALMNRVADISRLSPA